MCWCVLVGAMCKLHLFLRTTRINLGNVIILNICTKKNGTYTIGQVCYEFQISPKNLDFKYYRKLEEVYSEHVIDIIFS